MTNFLPENYTPPKSTSRYTKFEQGQTKIRILSNSIQGFEYFTSENKPKRSKTPFQKTPDIKKDGKVKEFWAFIVYNYGTKSIEICEVTQAGIKNAIFTLYQDEDYGDPKNFDLKINRDGEGLDTVYTVTPAPIKEIEKFIKERYEAENIYIEALFSGNDPFAGKPIDDEFEKFDS